MPVMTLGSWWTLGMVSPGATDGADDEDSDSSPGLVVSGVWSEDSMESGTVDIFSMFPGILSQLTQSSAVDV